MEIFISWAGKRSRIFAIKLSEFIERVLHPIKPWLSTKIDPGVRWFQEIGDKLSNNTVGIICVTPENQDRPWLLFEAGALSKIVENKDSHVIPILLGLEPSDLEGPLKQFQSKTLKKEDIYSVLSFLNNKLGNNARREEFLRDDFELRWDKFIKELEDELQSTGLKTSRAFGSLLKSLQSSGLPEPEIGKTVHFREGFESHVIYETVFQTVMNRLWVLGRKNRKMFDKNYIDYYMKLPEKVKCGFDFRCLFLSPKAPNYIIYSSHQSDSFLEELRRSIKNAEEMVSRCKISADKHFRFYSIQRPYEIIIADDAVLYTPITYDISGRAKILTKASFKMTTVFTAEGNTILENFSEVWNASNTHEEIA